MPKILKNNSLSSSRRKPGSRFLTAEDPGFCRGDARSGESGNMLFMILIAVVLIGLLSAAIMNSGSSENSSIDKETLTIRATEAQRYGSELERAVMFIMSNGKSEEDIRFANPGNPTLYGDPAVVTDKSVQVFAAEGGGATYRDPPADINDGSAWEFLGTSAIPGIGTSKPDIVAVLPNVTPQFCEKINNLNGQPATLDDTGSSAGSSSAAGDCVYNDQAGINDSVQFLTPANTFDETTFALDPNTSAVRAAPEACVRCGVGPAYHFYHVLLAR